MKKSILAILGTLILSQFATAAPPLVVSKYKLWKDKDLNIAFVSGTPEEKELIKQFAMPWTKYADLDFHFYDSLEEVPSRERAHIRILIGKRDDKNPFAGDSHVGTNSLYNPKGYSMRIFIKEGEMLSVLRGVVLHEMGHALGLNHEHQHPERTYAFDEAKLLESCRARGISDTRCRQIYTETFSQRDHDLLTYDPDSIMHYSLDRNYVQSGPEEVFIGATDLSLLDKIGIARTYPGRISEEEIIADHEAEKAKLDSTEVVKSCRIYSFTSGGGKFYTYENPETGFALGYGISSRQGILLNMELDPKCDSPVKESPEEDEQEIKGVEVDKSDPRETKIKTLYFPPSKKTEDSKCAIVMPGEKTGQVYIDTYSVTMNWYVVTDAAKKKNVTGTGFSTLEHAQAVLETTGACR